MNLFRLKTLLRGSRTSLSSESPGGPYLRGWCSPVAPVLVADLFRTRHQASCIHPAESNARAPFEPVQLRGFDLSIRITDLDPTGPSWLQARKSEKS